MDDKNDHDSQEINKKASSRTEVLELNDGSFAVIIPEEIIEKLGWREGEGLKVDIKEDKISVSRTGAEAERGKP